MLFVIYFRPGALALTFLPVAAIVVGIFAFHDKHRRHLSIARRLNEMRSLFLSERPYVLFLRSFTSELRKESTYILVEHEYPEHRVIHGEIFETGRKKKLLVEEGRLDTDALDVLLELFEDTPVLVIDGRPQELHSRPLTILSEDSNWRTIYEVLATGAAAVIIMPEVSESLKLEIENSLAKYRNKIAFFMPPTRESGGYHLGSLHGATRRRRWSEVQALLPASLPDYKTLGALLRPEPDGCGYRQMPLSMESAQELLRPIEPASWPLNQAVSELQARGLADFLVKTLESEYEALPRRMKVRTQVFNGLTGPRMQ